MQTYEATEQAYKNGYEDGYRDGKNRAMEDIAFHKSLARPPEPSKEELEALMCSPVIITKDRESITQIYPYSRWIPVTERLPEYENHVLTYRGESGISVERMFPGATWDFDYDIIDAVTHWMPLPEPPKGE